MHSFYQALFNAWSLFLLWVIGGVYIPREYYNRRIERFRRTPKVKIWNEDDIALRKGHVAVITGGSRGIGIVLVKKLLSAGLHVVIGSSSSEESRRNLSENLKTEAKSDKIDVWHLDLSSMSSVTAFAKKFIESRLPLNVLINNAGIMFVPYKETEDQLESHFAVNFAGHCLLTKLLLPQLRGSGTAQLRSRIINVTSCVAAVSKIIFEDLQGRNYYSPYHAYMQSKLAQLMFSYALNNYLETAKYDVAAYCIHPGVVDTSLHEHVWWAPKAINNLYKRPEEGADVIIAAIFSSTLEGLGGKYLEDCKVTKSCRYSLKKDVQDKLWTETWSILDKWLPENAS